MNGTEDLLWEAVAAALQVPVEQLKEEAKRLHQKRLERIQHNNAQFASALSRVTEIQSAVITSREANGWQTTTRIWINRETQNVAIPMQKQAWNPAKGRVTTKLSLVYPDGSVGETFEKRLSIKGRY